MILSLFYCIFLISLPCRKFGIVKNYALFGLKVFTLKLGKMTFSMSDGEGLSSTRLPSLDSFLYFIFLTQITVPFRTEAEYSPKKALIIKPGIAGSVLKHLCH